MAKTTPLGVRLSVETRQALEAAAKADHRSMSSLMEKVLNEWLQKHGYLPLP